MPGWAAVNATADATSGVCALRAFPVVGTCSVASQSARRRHRAAVVAGGCRSGSRLRVENRAAATPRAYASDWGEVDAWCGRRATITLPAASATVAAYLAPGHRRCRVAPLIPDAVPIPVTVAQVVHPVQVVPRADIATAAMRNLPARWRHVDRGARLASGASLGG